MKIAFLADAASANTQSWARGLSALGHELEIITVHGGNGADCPVRSVGNPVPGKLAYIAAIPSVKRILDKLNPDLVVGYYLASYGLVAALSWNGPLVLAAAGSDILSQRYENLVAKRVIRFVISKGNLFLAWAQHMGDRLVQLGAPHDRILVLPRGIDQRIFRPDGPKGKISRLGSVISTRRLKPVYDFETSIRAFALLCASGQDVEYWVCGEGPLREDLEGRVESHGLSDRVIFAGAMRSDRVAACLRASSVYLSASKSDGVSASLLEAMACGVFPVVSDIAANRNWIVPNENGLLVGVGDVAGFAEAMRCGLLDEDLREKAFLKNQEIIREKVDQRKNLMKMTDRFEDLLKGNHV